MRSKLCKMCIWLATVICVLGTQEIVAAQNVIEAVEGHNQEPTFLVSAEDLYFYGSDILVNLNGHAYPVHSLEKKGDQWAATVLGEINYCPQGHPLCRNCGLCHKEKCRYYVRHCRLWE